MKEMVIGGCHWKPLHITYSVSTVPVNLMCGGMIFVLHDARIARGVIAFQSLQGLPSGACECQYAMHGYMSLTKCAWNRYLSVPTSDRHCSYQPWYNGVRSFFLHILGWFRQWFRIRIGFEYFLISFAIIMGTSINEALLGIGSQGS